MDKKIYSLLAVSRAIENVIQTHAGKQMWVKAEIVKLNHYTQSGHCYPDLVEKRDGKIVAEMRGNIWHSNFEKINDNFKAILNEELKDNMTVVCLATVQFHPVYGLSLNISDIDPHYTLGELARQKAETIQRLQQENLFAENKKRSLPLLPKTIAVISVETSKGYQDFMDVIKNNHWKYQFHIKLFPAILQGTQATKTITQALQIIEQHLGIFDAVAIIRGGGGDIGLSSFDNYELARAVATFPIPVLCGIGHSTNQTITEMVSFKDFITPTKIAEFLIQEFHNFSVAIDDNNEFIQKYVREQLVQQASKLREIARLFSSITQLYLQQQNHELSSSGKIISNLTGAFFKDEKSKLNDIIFAFKSQSDKHGIFEYNRIQQIQKLLFMFTLRYLENQKTILGNNENKMNILSPANILKRGFSITRINGKLLKDVKFARVDDEIETQLSNGLIKSKIKKIQ